MILLKKRPHLILKTPFAVVRLLLINVVDESANVRRTDGKQTIPTLPSEITYPLLLHPDGRSRLDLRYELRSRSCHCQSYREMNMVGSSTRSKALTIQSARRSSEICKKRSANIFVDQRGSMFRAENNMNQVEAQRLGHGKDYMPGLQPFAALTNAYLGLRPRLVCRRTFGPRFGSRGTF
jgi:hypothetical protein